VVITTGWGVLLKVDTPQSEDFPHVQVHVETFFDRIEVLQKEEK
jgi:hypothetical protein